MDRTAQRCVATARTMLLVCQRLATVLKELVTAGMVDSCVKVCCLNPLPLAFLAYERKGVGKRNMAQERETHRHTHTHTDRQSERERERVEMIRKEIGSYSQTSKKKKLSYLSTVNTGICLSHICLFTHHEVS